MTKQRAEVVAVSIFEYNEEEELKKIRAAEFSVGREAGYEEGEAVGKAESVLEPVSYTHLLPNCSAAGRE